ncbi:MAG TPA: FtsQ-type POTRA domain-containing protein [Acidimicrobiales bacterium]
MDPRIRERRIQVRRHEGRRRLRLVVTGMGIILLSASGWLALRSPLLDVDRVTVRGADRTPAEWIRDATGIWDGQPLVEVDLDAAAAAVEGLPWVDSADVRRVWPSTALVTVTERTPSAVTSSNTGEWAVLDGTGRVLELVPERPPGLLVLEGLGELPPPGTTVASASGPLTVFAALSPSLAARTSAVVALESGQIELKLNPQGTVRLGTVDALEAKVRAAETVLASVDVRGLVLLDVRLPSSPVLTRG